VAKAHLVGFCNLRIKIAMSSIFMNNQVGFSVVEEKERVFAISFIEVIKIKGVVTRHSTIQVARFKSTTNNRASTTITIKATDNSFLAIHTHESIVSRVGSWKQVLEDRNVISAIRIRKTIVSDHNTASSRSMTDNKSCPSKNPPGIKKINKRITRRITTKRTHGNNVLARLVAEEASQIIHKEVEGLSIDFECFGLNNRKNREHAIRDVVLEGWSSHYQFCRRWQMHSLAAL